VIPETPAEKLKEVEVLTSVMKRWRRPSNRATPPCAVGTYGRIKTTRLGGEKRSESAELRTYKKEK